jgi:tetratricopeptide (TPR) repeat protein
MMRRGLVLLFLFGLFGYGIYSWLTQPASYRDAVKVYEANNLVEARRVLEDLLGRNPDDKQALALLGFIANREGNFAEAESVFRHLLEQEQTADGYYGLGISLRNQGRNDEAYRVTQQALALDPQHSDAAVLLNSLAPDKRLTPLVRGNLEVAGLRVPFSVQEGYFQVGGKPLLIKGVNLGVALPGKFPSEFPEERGVYAQWLELLGAMNANVIRLYTILPPVFYEALYAYNVAHPDAPLYLIHGVWTELPENHQYAGDFQEAFLSEAFNVIDVLHGQARLEPRLSHASGTYTADVSPWLLGFIIGREWEPFSVKAFDQTTPGRSYQGEFLSCENCTATEAWLAEVMNDITHYQVQTYQQQTPIAFTNWPTLDPLYHVTEATRAQEAALRQARGESYEGVPVNHVDFNDDESTVDATKILATPSFLAGHFASYHAYPYYPDFMNLSPEYAGHPVSNYQGYLEALKRYHGEQAVLISEFGVPSSRGMAHFNPFGFHHGGHSEAEQAARNLELFEQIKKSGAAGGIVFAWLDEWFKHNWLYIDLELPAARNPFWHSVMDAEQNYGIMSTERLGPHLGSKANTWFESKLVAENSSQRLRALAEPQYLHVFLEGATLEGVTTGGLELFLDTHPAPGDEFRIELGASEGKLWINGGYQLFKEFAAGTPWALYLQDFKAAPSGTDWAAWITEPNRRRLGRDGTLFERQTNDVGVLKPGSESKDSLNPLADYFIQDDTLHLRLPWTLLGFTDPSQKTIYDGSQERLIRTVSDIGIAVRGERLQGRFSWQNWQNLDYDLRLKPLYYALQRHWADETQ